MKEFIYIVGPGIFTYFTAEKLAGKKEQRWFIACMEMLFYSFLNVGIFWLIRMVRNTNTEEEVQLLEITGKNFWIMLLISLILGIVMAYFKKLNAELVFTEARRNKESKKNPLSGILKVIATLACAVLIVGLIFAPRVQEKLLERSKIRTRAFVTEYYTKLKREISEQLKDQTTTEALADITIDNVTAERVDGDQKWKEGTGVNHREAVYMIDGNGTLVYFSYRDKDFAGTWSGPSTDEAFLASHANWVGYGWSGILMK